MLKYTKIINESTKEVSIALGSNPPSGYIEMDVEQSWDSKWYISGYAPQKPEEVIKQERIAELKQMLADADYWGQKYLDGEYTDEEWAEKVAQRKAWREEIRRLEDDNN